MDLREAARTIFLQALQAVEPASFLRSRLQLRGEALQILSAAGAASIPLRPFDEVRIVAVGKAAVPMTEVLLEVLRPVQPLFSKRSGVVVGTALPRNPDSALRYRTAGHPLPNAASFSSAREILSLLQGSSERTLVFFLLSGGASAMMELPIDPAWSVEDMVALHRGLVHSGLPIGAMNALRKHLSAVKGGRLALAAAPATQCTLLVSDVPPSTPEVIGSGPSLPDPTTLVACRQVAAQLRPASLPEAARRLLFSTNLEETPKAGDAAFARSSMHPLLSSDDLCRAAQGVAEALGFAVTVESGCDDWPAERAADHLLSLLFRLPRDRGPVCLLSSGELAVPIEGAPGTGGRNQHFALCCARQMARHGLPATVLSAGSDGADGNSAAAGALVDADTVARAAAANFSVDDALARFDAYPLLHRLGDTLITGPTGNNLRDLRVLLRAPA